MRRLALGLLLALVATTPALADYTVSGTCLYVDREFDENGFTGAEPTKPIRFAVVQVVLAGNNKVDASGETDANGDFSFTVVDDKTRDIYVRCLARHEAPAGIPVEVRSEMQASTVWAIRTADILDHPPNQDVFIGSLAAVPEAGGEAFNLFDNLSLGAAYLNYLRGGEAPAPLLLATFSNANPSLSSYDGAAIVQARNAGYDDTVLLHEMGHYVVDHFSATDSPFGSHRLSDCEQDLRLAFDEGHATHFGLSVRRHFNLTNSSTYTRTTGQAGPGNLQFSFDIETQEPFICYGGTSETTVYAALWDILDGPGATDGSPGVDEVWDLLQGLDHDYWEVMTTYLPTAADICLEDFWDGWFHPSVNNGYYPEMVGIFDQLGVEYYPDLFEPNDDTSEAEEITPGTTIYHLTYFADRNVDLLGEPDPDFMTFQATGGVSYTIETFNLLGDSNTSLELLDSDGTTVLASNDDRSVSDHSSVIVHSPAQGGPLYVRSFHGSGYGIYGSYDFRISVGSGGVDNDQDGYSSDVDCNDDNPSIHPDAPEVCNFLDDDCDDYIDEGLDPDGDGYTNCAGDCNPANPDIYPGATELCNGIDDDCDGPIDEDFDDDLDGFSECSGDCDDGNPDINPDEPEVCNGIDDDCNQIIDDGFDVDDDGFTICAGDCDDSNPDVNPGQVEECNGIDDNCAMGIDEGFPDSDGDGQMDCVDPDDDDDGTLDAFDCAPLDYTMWSVPEEVIERLDIGLADSTQIDWDQVPGANVYNIYRKEVPFTSPRDYSVECLVSELAGAQYADADVPPLNSLFYYIEAGTNACGLGDLGLGSGGTPRSVSLPCAPQEADSDTDGLQDLIDICPMMSNADQADVDRDGRGDVCDNCIAVANPTQVDMDANGQGDHCQDIDEDGYLRLVDCDDDNPDVFPGATEVCNLIDDNCDEEVDEGFDGDEDGFTSCGGDCNDGNPAIHPDAEEVFNGVDDDCNDIIDDVVEVVTITLATHQAANSRLTVEATTNYPEGSVTLTVVDFGTMTYVPAQQLYRLEVQPTEDPGSVMVVSTAGGSDTAPVTPI